MTPPLSTDSYKGVRDFYPEDWMRLAYLFERLRHELALWGYEEYNASPLERAELYEAKSSQEIVNEQTYTFTDRGERRVTLRPEMTPTLARMVAAKRRELAFPLRWFSIPNVFRYERPQRGRLREHYQLNVDLVGASAGAADLEVIRLAASLLTSLGASAEDFVIKINSRRLLNAACAAAHLEGDAAQHYLRALDRKDKMSAEDFAATVATLGGDDPLRHIEEPTGAVAEAKEELFALIEDLRAAGVTNAVFEPTITRGFDYYTGVIFEVYDTDPANARALFGGGRYDELLALFGGDPIPAIGFGMGDVGLRDFLETHGLVPHDIGLIPTVYIGTPDSTDIREAQRLADTLRKSHIRVFVNLSSRSLGDQIKDALKRSVPYFIAYGSEEVKTGSVKVKELATSSETLVSVAELPSALGSHA